MQDINDLIIKHKGLVYKQLHKFGLVDDPDAISYAFEALYNAIQSYKTDKNSKFSTYATVCIYNRLGSYVRSLNTQILQNTTSYDAPINEEGMTMLDVLDSSAGIDDAIMLDCTINDITVCIILCMNELSNELHRKIVGTWVDSGFSMTHTNIADMLGCTQSYVSQVIKVFRYNLKKKLEEY